MTGDNIKDISPALRSKIIDLIVDGVHRSVDCPVQALKIILAIADGFDKADPIPDPTPEDNG